MVSRQEKARRKELLRKIEERRLDIEEMRTGVRPKPSKIAAKEEEKRNEQAAAAFQQRVRDSQREKEIAAFHLSQFALYAFGPWLLLWLLDAPGFAWGVVITLQVVVGVHLTTNRD